MMKVIPVFGPRIFPYLLIWSTVLRAMSECWNISCFPFLLCVYVSLHQPGKCQLYMVFRSFYSLWFIFYSSGLFIICLVAVMSAIMYEALRLVYMFFHLRAHQNPILYGHKVTNSSTLHRLNSESLQSLISNLSVNNIKKTR